MAVYRLSPIAAQRSRPEWEASTHHDVCHVGAESEAEARDFAVHAFTIATKRDTRRDVLFCPWRMEELTDCVEVVAIGAPIPHGMVTTPERPAPFLPADG